MTIEARCPWRSDGLYPPGTLFRVEPGTVKIRQLNFTNYHYSVVHLTDVILVLNHIEYSLFEFYSFQLKQKIKLRFDSRANIFGAEIDSLTLIR